MIIAASSPIERGASTRAAGASPRPAGPGSGLETHARVDDALIRFDQFERRIDDIEAHVESYDLGGKKSLKDEFSELENEDAVAQELRELKSKRAGQKRGNEST